MTPREEPKNLKDSNANDVEITNNQDIVDAAQVEQETEEVAKVELRSVDSN